MLYNSNYFLDVILDFIYFCLAFYIGFPRNSTTTGNRRDLTHLAMATTTICSTLGGGGERYAIIFMQWVILIFIQFNLLEHYLRDYCKCAVVL